MVIQCCRSLTSQGFEVPSLIVVVIVRMTFYMAAAENSQVRFKAVKKMEGWTGLRLDVNGSNVIFMQMDVTGRKSISVGGGRAILLLNRIHEPCHQG